MNKREITPILKMPVEVQATAALREAIVTGAVVPGARITEVGLAAQMQLSRSTIRIALQQLNQEGLITLIRYSGWKVTELGSRDIWELYTLRSAIERLAGRLVAGALAESMDPTIVNTLNEAFDSLIKQCERSNRDMIADADFALHKAIISLARHGRLASQYGLIEQQIRMYIRSSDNLVADPEQIIEQHRPIVEAILGGDVEEAGRRSEIHNIIEGGKLSDYLAKRVDTAGQKRAKPSKSRTRIAE